MTVVGHALLELCLAGSERSNPVLPEPWRLAERMSLSFEPGREA